VCGHLDCHRLRRSGLCEKEARGGYSSGERNLVSPTLSIVIPAYNEEENVPLLHGAIRAVIEPADIDAEIIFVDDGSKDGTWAAIEKQVAIDPRVRGLKLKSNCGETAACDAGLARLVPVTELEHWLSSTAQPTLDGRTA